MEERWASKGSEEGRTRTEANEDGVDDGEEGDEAEEVFAGDDG